MTTVIYKENERISDQFGIDVDKIDFLRHQVENNDDAEIMCMVKDGMALAVAKHYRAELTAHEMNDMIEELWEFYCKSGTLARIVYEKTEPQKDIYEKYLKEAV